MEADSLSIGYGVANRGASLRCTANYVNEFNLCTASFNARRRIALLA